MVEHLLAMQKASGSSPVDRSGGNMADKFNGAWFVLNRKTKEYLESRPTKNEAMKVVNGLNESEKRAGREPIYAVVPGSSDKRPQ